MELAEAYERLNFAPPVAYEQAILAMGTEGLRRIGTSMRTMIELYLDLALARKAVPIRDRHRVRFLCVCLSPLQAEYLAKQLAFVHEALSLDVDLERVRFFPYDARDSIIRGDSYYTWGVFCDHAVKELSGAQRNYGPYGLVRYVEKIGDDVFEARDRDGCKLCLLTKDGAHELLDETTCPITYDPGGAAPTTFGAWMRGDLQQCIRMQKAFDL